MLQPLFKEYAKEKIYKSRKMQCLEAISCYKSVTFSSSYDEIVKIIDGEIKIDTRTGDEIVSSIKNQFK